MGQTWKFGTMEARFEEPDTLFSAVTGQADAETMSRFNALAAELAAKHGPLFFLADMAKLTGLSPEARKLSTEGSGPDTFAAMAFYGANFATRTLVNMMVRANQLLGRQDNPMSFFATEAEARAFLAEEKRKRQNLANSA